MEDESDISLDNISTEDFQDLSDEEPQLSLESLKKVSQPPQQIPTLPERGTQPAVSSKPVVVEDFIRNYLKQMKMEKTLNTFQVYLANSYLLIDIL